LVGLLIMSRQILFRNIAGVLSGTVAVAAVIWFVVKHSRVNVASVATSGVVVALLALLVAVATTRAAGTALFAAGMTLLINDVLLAARFATILGFGHLSLADSIGLWPASALLVLAISSAYVLLGVLKRRWFLAVAVALTVLVSWPAKLSSRFFV